MGMNALSVIFPYKHLGVWMFDDDRVGLNGEPFIAGADVMMERLASRIPNAERGFRLLFSTAPFPGYQARLDWIREDTQMPGNWYSWAQEDLEGWLCPALLLYFPEAPRTIYVKAEPMENRGSAA